MKILAALLLSGALALVTGGAGVASGPVRIAFVSSRASATTDLYVMNADGSNQHRVRASAKFDEGRSSWSPDGLSIAFEISPRNALGTSSRIAVMDAKGGVKLLTPVSGPGGTYLDAREPAWSPNGNRVAFSETDSKHGYRIFTIARDGKELLQVTNGSFDRAPAWSPDSARIAFARFGGLWIVNADGSGVVRIAAGSFSDPAWSPNGTMIACTRANAKTGATDLYTVPAAGGAVHQLTKTPKVSERYPSWSPDGTTIALQLGSHPGQIYVMNANGTGVTQLTTNPKGAALPSFTR